eukprot:1180311-Prorocentrum_minimum.AAC.3
MVIICSFSLTRGVADDGGLALEALLLALVLERAAVLRLVVEEVVEPEGLHVLAPERHAEVDHPLGARLGAR